jgi:hypothetical protein
MMRVPLSKPPLDENGEVVPHDHEGIANEDRVIRRVSAEHFVPDSKVSGGKRISTMAFQPSTDGNRGMSVDLEASIIEAGLDTKVFVTTPRFLGSVWFLAGFLRAETFMVGYDPVNGNAHHGEVWGTFQKGRQRKLLNAARWYVEVDGVSLPSAAV